MNQLWYELLYEMNQDCNEFVLITILTSIDQSQRKIIEKRFKQMFDKDLIRSKTRATECCFVCCIIY